MRKPGSALAAHAITALLIVLLGAAQVWAQSKPALVGINLQLNQSRPFRGLSQTDWRWADVEVGARFPSPTMATGGCAMTSIAMVANYFGLMPIENPSIPQWNPQDTSPVAIHETLLYHDGYVSPDACDVCIDWENALAGAFWDPALNTVGLRIVNTGAWPAGEAEVDQKLAAGVPSFLNLRLEPDEPRRTHLIVVVGWDEPSQSYLIFDPYMATGATVVSAKNHYGVDWRQKVYQALTVERIPGLTFANNVQLWINSPLEALVIDPLGRRTGFNSATGIPVYEIPESGYGYQAWSDATGLSTPGEPAKALIVGSAAPGMYSFSLVGTGNGPFTLLFRSRAAGGLLDEIITGVTTLGERRKYELEIGAQGQRVLRRDVTNFSPHAIPAAPPIQAVGLPIAFTGGRSFDPDGSIQSHSWTFGDGASASGSDVSHAYTTEGTYAVTLTVRDDQGLTTSGEMLVTIFSPIAAPSDGTTTLVSLMPTGEQVIGPIDAPSLSADGTIVAFRTQRLTSFSQEVQPVGVWTRNLVTGTTEGRAIPMLPNYFEPFELTGHRLAMSADGAFVAFEASGAVVPEDTNGTPDIYVIERASGAATRVSIGVDGMQGNRESLNVAISSDGRFIAFDSRASTLVPNDLNGSRDIFVRDQLTGTTELISVARNSNPPCPYSNAGYECNAAPDISANGRFVVWESPADNLVAGNVGPWYDIFLRDRTTGLTEQVSVGSSGAQTNGDSVGASISADGRFVVFESDATNLVPDDTNAARDIFVRDRLLGATERVSVSSQGAQSIFVSLGNANFSAAISADGRFVAFNSVASNLVPSDQNGLRDMFVRDRLNGTTDRMNVAFNGAESCCRDFTGFNFGNSAGFDMKPSVSADGNVLLFASNATNLAPVDANGPWTDLFVRVRGGATRPVAQPSGPYLGWATTDASPASVTFDGSRSVDAGSGTLTATWNFGDGSAPVSAGTTVPVSHAYTQAGRYTVTLQVNNGREDSSVETTTVDVLAPLTRTLTAAPVCVAPGGMVALTSGGHAVAPRAGGWNLADGPVPAIDDVPFGMSYTLAIDGPQGSHAEGLAIITSIAMVSGLEYSVNALWSTRADLVPGIYGLSSDHGSATLLLPCPPANRAPLANAGGPYRVGPNQPLTFDGAHSTDPDGDALTFTWDFGDDDQGSGVAPTHTYTEPGTYYVTLSVNDGQVDSPSTVGARFIAVVRVTASDVIPPSTTASTSPMANAAGWASTDVVVTLSASDDAGGSGVASVIYSATGAQTIAPTTVSGSGASFTVRAEGQTIVSFHAIDNGGNVEATKVLTIAIDRTAPTATCVASPAIMWPPNHRMVPVTVSTGLTDALDGAVGLRLVSVTSSEPDNGLGDGDASGDIQNWTIGTSDGAGSLRAERSGGGRGRVYTLTYRGEDAAGNTGTCSTTVTVPHNR